STRFGWRVSCLSSASLNRTQSTPLIVSISESRALSIQKFIESIATKRALAHWARTSRWRSGWILARNTTSAPLERSESFGPDPPKWRSEGPAVLKIPPVLAGPEERLSARDVLDVVDVDPTRAEDGVLVVAKVVADGADDVDGVEERCGQREVHRRATEHLLA